MGRGGGSSSGEITEKKGGFFSRFSRKKSKRKSRNAKGRTS